jgi:hypothetical protein
VFELFLQIEIEMKSLMIGNCRLCERTKIAGKSYCSYHYRAFSEIEARYADWRSAFENMSWERYLETIIRLNETGDFAKEVAREELRLKRIQ